MNGEQRTSIAYRYLGLAAFAGLLCAQSAHATVAQPDGKVVPIDSRPTPTTGEKQIYDAFKPEDKAANLRFREDATTSPEVFSPLCKFTAEMLLKETASDLAIGW